MKNVLKLESLGLLILFSFIYFHLYPGSWGFFFALFFAPDISFAFYLISKKIGAVGYNILHHQGFIAMVLLLGYFLQNDLIIKISLIFMAHSTFDRVMGYGLKYFDGFEHTHLGWIGKSKQMND